MLLRLMRPEKPKNKWGASHVNLSNVEPVPEWYSRRRVNKEDPGNADEGTRRTRSLITGCAGFVGRHLTDVFIKRGDEITATDREPKAHRADVNFVSADIRDKEAMRKVTQGKDMVIHNASLVHTKMSQRHLVWDVNKGGTESLIEACLANNVKRFIYISSASVNYNGDDIVDGDESMPYATKYMAHYAASKIEAEKLVLKANGTVCADGKTKLITCALRPHVIFGPGDQRFLPALLERSLNSCLRIRVGYDGSRNSDYCFVMNLVDACCLVDENLYPGARTAGQAYFITNSEPLNMFDFVNRVLVQSDLPTFERSLPDGLLLCVGYIWEFIDCWIFGGRLNSERGFSSFAIRYLCTHHYFTCKKAEDHFGFKPRIKLAEGIKYTAQSIRDVLKRSGAGPKVNPSSRKRKTRVE